MSWADGKGKKEGLRGDFLTCTTYVVFHCPAYLVHHVKTHPHARLNRQTVTIAQLTACLAKFKAIILALSFLLLLCLFPAAMLISLALARGQRRIKSVCVQLRNQSATT